MLLSAYKTLTEQAPILIWRSNTEGLCDYFNAQWIDFRGRTMEQELGEGWVEGVHPEDRGRCMEIYLSHFHEQKIFEMEYRLMRADGAYRWIFDRGCPYYDEQGDFQGYIGSCIDVSERVEVQQEKEKIYLASVHGAQHILNNMLNQLTAVKMEMEQHADFDRETISLFDVIVEESSRLMEKLSSVEDIDEEQIRKTVEP